MLIIILNDKLQIEQLSKPLNNHSYHYFVLPGQGFIRLFESSIDAVFLMDENKFLDCNNATLKLFGLTKKTDFLHLHPADVSPESQADKKTSRKTIDAHIYKTLKKGSMKFTWIYKKSNGETFPAEVWLNCLKLDGKSLIQGTIREITNNHN